jgi:hypothetical protein
MIQTRRSFVKSSGMLLLATTAGGSIELTGCDSLGNYLSVGLAAFSSLVALLAKDGVLTASNPLVMDVNAAFAAAMAADQTYQKDKAAGTSALVAALDAVNAALQAFTSQAVIPSTLITLVLDAVEIIISTIAGWAGTLVPTITVKGTLTAKSGQTKAVVAKKRSKHTFISDWNATVTRDGSPQLTLKNSWF